MVGLGVLRVFLGVVSVHEYHDEADYADALWWYSIQCLGFFKNKPGKWHVFPRIASAIGVLNYFSCENG